MKDDADLQIQIDLLEEFDSYSDEQLNAQMICWLKELQHRRATMLQSEPQNAPQNIPVNIPAGYVLVPIEPTEDMVINGFESEPSEGFSETDVWEAYEAMSGCQQAAHRAELCWAAMIAAAPKVQF